MDREEMMAILEEHEALTADGHDNAIVGVGSYFGEKGPLVLAIYDREKVVQNLMQDMDREAAEEFFEFNIAGAGMGKKTPVFVDFAQ